MRGFTLIEISIVLIIIGLISGAIFVGRDLIRTAEIRKVHRQFEEFATSVHTFQTKYNCLPGDCPNATDFFGKNPACPSLSDPAYTADTPAHFFSDIPTVTTCNGDGDGRLDAQFTFYEMTTFWQQLADAGLIPGQYSGGWHTAASSHAWVGGFNTPPVLTNVSHWMVLDGDQSILLSKIGQPATIVPGPLGTIFNASAGSTNPQVKIFTPSEAAAYDAKYDDGSPVKGQIMVAYGSNHCTNAADETIQDPINATAQYLSGDKLYKDAYNCALIYRAGF